MLEGRDTHPCWRWVIWPVKTVPEMTCVSSVTFTQHSTMPILLAGWVRQTFKIIWCRPKTWHVIGLMSVLFGGRRIRWSGGGPPRKSTACTSAFLLKTVGAVRVTCQQKQRRDKCRSLPGTKNRLKLDFLFCSTRNRVAIKVNSFNSTWESMPLYVNDCCTLDWKRKTLAPKDLL